MYYIYFGNFYCRLYLKVSDPRGGDASVAPHHRPVPEPDAARRGEDRRRQAHPALQGGDEGGHTHTLTHTHSWIYTMKYNERLIDTSRICTYDNGYMASQSLFKLSYYILTALDIIILI